MLKFGEGDRYEYIYRILGFKGELYRDDRFCCNLIKTSQIFVKEPFANTNILLEYQERILNDLLKEELTIIGF